MAWTKNHSLSLTPNPVGGGVVLLTIEKELRQRWERGNKKGGMFLFSKNIFVLYLHIASHVRIRARWAGGWVLHQPPWSFGFDSQARGGKTGAPCFEVPGSSRVPVRDGQTSPHRLRLVVSRSTCPALSPPSPHSNSFVIGPALINTKLDGPVFP